MSMCIDYIYFQVQIDISFFRGQAENFQMGIFPKTVLHTVLFPYTLFGDCLHNLFLANTLLDTHFDTLFENPEK